jgi:hypothetical protein
MRVSVVLLLAVGVAAGQSPVGIFEGQGDLGEVLTAGQTRYDPAAKSYTIDASGENMWFAKDEFHFVWKKVSDDFTLEADILFPTGGGNAHKKAVLMARQSLAADSAYVDIAVHGDGLTSLQARDEAGANTHEVGINAAKPVRARLEKRGDYFYMYLAGAQGEALRFSGASMRVQLKTPFYVGIGVCAHDKNAMEQAVFSNLALNQGASHARMTLYSTIETISIASTDRRVVFTERGRLKDASWTGKDIVFRNGAALFRAPSAGGAPVMTDATVTDMPWTEGVSTPDRLVNCQLHPSPGNKVIAFVSYPEGTTGCPAEDREAVLRVWSPADGKVRVLARFAGGAGSLNGHPWSADGKSLTFVSYHQVPE